MRSKKFITLTAMSILGISGVLMTLPIGSTSNLNETQLINLEALTGEELPCNNYNGYRRIQEGNEKIYDCCYKEQIGRGHDDCKRW